MTNKQRKTMTGEFGTRCTDYLPLEQLEQYLLGVFYANEFNKLIGNETA